MIKIFFDTNVIRGQMFSDSGGYSLSDFKFSRNLSKVIDLIDEMNIKKTVKLIIPEIVINEIRQQKIESFEQHQLEFKKSCELYKNIFGENIQIKFSQLSSKEDYIKKLNISIDQFVKANKKVFEIVKLDKSLDYIVGKAINKEMMFVSAKGLNNKEFSDAGLKDHLILEVIIQESNFNEDLIILYSKDTDFDKACEHYNFKRIDNVDSLKNYILENCAEAKEKSIIRELNSDDNKMKIAGYCKDHNNRSKLTESLVVIKILKEACLINEDLNEMQIKIECKLSNKKYILEITLDLEEMIVIDAKEV